MKTAWGKNRDTKSGPPGSAVMTDISLISLLLLVSFCTLFVVPVMGGTETLISVNTSDTDQSDPAISGNWIVWTDLRSGTPQIYGYNVVTGVETRISSVAAIATQPDISSDNVVWRDGRGADYDIYRYSLTDSTETPVTTASGNQEFPAISGDRIVWQDSRSGKTDIYLYNLPSSQEYLLTPGTPDTDQLYPAVSGAKVVWQDRRNYYTDLSPAGYYNDIFMNDTATCALTNISHAKDYDAAFPGSEEYTPAISGDNAVWVDERYAEKGDIFLNDTLTATQSPVTEVTSSFKILPAIDGMNVIWLDNRPLDGSNYNIYQNTIVTLPAPDGSDTPITTTGTVVYGSGRGPKISGDRIVWTDSRNGKTDVYMYTLGADQTCPVADFSMSAQSGSTPLTVDFTDTSDEGTTAISHRKWEFGDGNSTDDTLEPNEENPHWTFEVPGTYNARLTVSNPLCRNETPASSLYTISIGAAPVAAFTSNETAGLVPLAIRFTDESTAATSWDWSFGDGTSSNSQNPVHTYTSGGTHTVVLKASNSYGDSTTQSTIEAKTGKSEQADTTVSGIGVDNRFGGQFLTFNKNTLAGYSQPSPDVLISPPLDDGWQNITFITTDPAGFKTSGNELTGNVTSVILQIKEIMPGDFSSRVGALSSVNYSVTVNTLPENARLTTRVWEGYTADDLSAFRSIASTSGYTNLHDIAYTTKIEKTNFPSGGTGRLRMSVASSWVTTYTDRNHVYAVRISDDRATGEVLPARFLYSANGLDHFEIDCPNGMSTFGLAQLSGSGNPLQLITLTAASYVSDSTSTVSSGSSGGTSFSSDKGSIKGPGVVAENKEQLSPLQNPVDSGRTGTVYANSNGIVSQATSVVATDTYATISLAEGITARDAGGNPLSAISIKATLPDMVQEGGPMDSDLTFENMAYELGPDGATFSPSVTLTVIPAEIHWNKEYVMRSYDRVSGTWQDLPTVSDPATGKVTAQISHFCCFGLFARTIVQTKSPAVSPVMTTPSDSVIPSPPPGTALSIFPSMFSWVFDILKLNIPALIIIVLIMGGVWAFGRRHYW